MKGRAAADTRYGPLSMNSKTLMEQAESQTGFFDPNNLVDLSPEGIEELEAAIQQAVQGSQDYLNYYVDGVPPGGFLGGDGDQASAEAYTSRYPQYQDTIGMGMVHEHFSEGGKSAEFTVGLIEAAFIEFPENALNAIDVSITLGHNIEAHIQGIMNGGQAYLDANQSELEAMPDAAKQAIVNGVTTILNSPETSSWNNDAEDTLIASLESALIPTTVERTEQVIQTSAPGWAR